MFCVVVCIALDVYCLEGVPARPHIVLGIGLHGNSSPTRLLLRWFSSVLTNPIPLRVVTTGVGCGPYPIPYSRICTLWGSPVAPDLTNPRAFRSHVLQASEYL
jgi:hypothetical protein